MSLTNHRLLKDKTLIDGKWVGANDGKTFSVYNPFDGSHIGDVPDMGAAETKAAIAAAAKAFPAWRDTTAANRAAILKRWYALQMEHLDGLALLLTTEQGKPLDEAKGEIRYGASFVEWFAEEARRVYGDVIPSHGSDLRIITIRQP
ncbi:MAG: aldehyde dehydrogenase family protein, partial [Phaeodactylibacter sp.]|nr:aldehyde dehydrogenase family protein [Phaeodactylibacter sp.]